MLSADARTNPFTWRACTHIHPTTDRPSRCLACGAIDHDSVPGRMRHGVGVNNTLQAMRMGGYIFGADMPKGPLGRRDVSHLLDEPCAAGHTGNRYVARNGRGTAGCRDCDRLQRKDWKNGIWSGHRNA